MLIDDDRLSDGDIRTYCQLLSHDSTGDGTYARQDTLASWLRVRSVDSVQRRLTNLEKCGYLHVQRRGMSKTNIVRCLMRVKCGVVIRLDKDGNVVDE